MNIEGLDYNTQREKMVLPEYGREVHKMVAHAIGLPTKAARLRCAKSIVKVMETRVPQVRANSNYRQTLWHHLYTISGGQLDIDWPCDISDAESIHSKPEPIPLPGGQVKMRHYGRLMQELLEKIAQAPDGKERKELVRRTANQMKRHLMVWGHGSMDDERVASDLNTLTGGALHINLKSSPLAKVQLPPDFNNRQGKKKKK